MLMTLRQLLRRDNGTADVLFGLVAGVVALVILAGSMTIDTSAHGRLDRNTVAVTGGAGR